MIIISLKTSALCKEVFIASILGDLEWVLVNIDNEWTIPQLWNYDILIQNNRSVPHLPIISMGGMLVSEERLEVINRNVKFLLFLFHVRYPPKPTWFEDFLKAKGLVLEDEIASSSPSRLK